MREEIGRHILHLPKGKSRPTQFKPRLALHDFNKGNNAPLKRDADAQSRKHFYDSALWIATRAAKLRRDPLCQCCAANGLATEGQHVDHWKPLAEGGNPTADDNLVTLCQPCHSHKTMSERNGTAYPKIVASKPRVIGIA